LRLLNEEICKKKRGNKVKTDKWIVMVEDDVDMHYLYKRVFTNLQLEKNLKLFDNALEALGFIRKFSNDTQLIFSDINMPMVDGIELKKRINADRSRKLQDIPFVFLSTSATEVDNIKASSLGIQGFYQKGLTLDEIEKTVKLVVTYWNEAVLPQSS
jgi:CheY-like chemotaxis protein